MQATHAGAVVFRSMENQTHFLVVSSSSGMHWVLPKGHIEPGESSDIAALRELREEAGIIGKIKASLGIQYFKKFEKNVAAQYFLVEALETVEALEERTLRWVDLATAMGLLSFNEARQALQEGLAALSASNGP